MDSPLRQQARPDVLKPKVVSLYETLFQDEQTDPSEGFWRELFLLKPDRAGLHSQIQRLSVENVLHGYQHACEQLFLRATNLARFRISPTDENALDTLAIFLENILNKRYGSPGADIITVLAGLDDVDAIFADFVAVLDDVIRTGKSIVLRMKAIRVATVAVAGMYQTSLVSYFINRDLFPALMKCIQESDSVEVNQAVMILLGLLLNYQKGEFLSPYRTRIEDFVNSSLISSITISYTSILDLCRDQYTAIQDDQVEAMGIGSALSWLRFNRSAPIAHQPSANMTEEQVIAAFTALPPSSTSTLLLLYDFSSANKLFRLELVTKSTSPKGPNVVPLASFISLSSYMFQHAHRSSRGSSYACLNLLTLHILLSDLETARKICSAENAASVRLCRQKAPPLPAVKGDRILAGAIIDAVMGGLSHNLRQRLDVELYCLLLSILIRLLTFLTITRTKLVHNYTFLWTSLFSLLRFLTTHATAFASTSSLSDVIYNLVALLSLSLSAGESFLPTTAAYDDLLYKVIESSDFLTKFAEVYDTNITSESSSSNAGSSAKTDMNFILAVSNYCQNLMKEANGGRGLGPSTNAREVNKVIRQGHDGLQAVVEEYRRGAGGARQLNTLEGYREGDWRSLMKRVARVVVVDARATVTAGMA